MVFCGKLARRYITLNMQLSEKVREEIDAKLIVPVTQEVPDSWTVSTNRSEGGCYFAGADRRPQVQPPYHLMVPRYVYLQE